MYTPLFLYFNCLKMLKEKYPKYNQAEYTKILEHLNGRPAVTFWRVMVILLFLISQSAGGLITRADQLK